MVVHTFSQYRRRWRDSHFAEIRRRFNDDESAFLAAFDKDYHLRHLESGMKLFTKLTRRGLTRFWSTAHLPPYKSRGLAALDAFLDALSTGERILTPETDFILACIDFEGGHGNPDGVHGFGIALLDTRDFLRCHLEDEEPLTELGITASNWRVGDYNEGFLFGNTTAITPEILRKTIINALTIPDTGHCATPRKIVLVGHGIMEDLSTLNSTPLNIDLAQDLPTIEGYIDTADLSHEILGFYPQLGLLLDWLGIYHPTSRPCALHCAGNDAVYTLKALLVLLYRRTKTERFEAPCFELHEMAYRAMPKRGPREKFEDWDLGLGGEEGFGGLWS